MLLIINKIEIDPGFILLSICFILSFLSCIATLIYYLYKKYKNRQQQRQIINDYYSL